jgi:hypothetical protein
LDVLFRFFMVETRTMTIKLGPTDQYLKVGLHEKLCNSVRPRHAVTTSAADQRTALRLKLSTNYSVKLVAACI